MVAYLTRRATFSAAHRLHNPELSDDENRAIYGKCNNPWGHGHDYALEVTVRDDIDPRTDMVMNLADLKEIMNQRIVDLIDHKHLNHDVAWLRGVNPTVENLAVVFWKRLYEVFPDQLYEVKLYETANNWAIYRGE